MSMKKRWIYKPLPSESAITKLCNEINVSRPIATILGQRGITDYNKAKNFFRPSLSDLHDPFKMKDMDKAAALLHEAVQNKDKILIYGDYDVDGTTSVALVYQYLSKITDNIKFYIPDRYTEGYGVSEKGIAEAIQDQVNLLITLDCGIKAINTIAKAKENGIKVIVCDHHLPGSELPPADAVLDPKRRDCSYPYKELSGCGLGFKLLQAYHQQYEVSIDPKDFLDYVAVSIAADIVPITGENRILAFYGLKKINQSPQPGLQALIKISASRRPLEISEVVFGIAPRINAAGRIAHAKAAVDLLIASNEKEADALAKKVNTKNDDRRQKDSLITKEALEMIEQNGKLGMARSTVLFKNDWNKGVIGIVASRCIEKFHRPTIILTESNNKATGSARSVPGFDIYQAIEECRDLLEQFGGHTHAAGLTMELAKVKLFQQKFEEVVSRNISDDALIPQVEIDVKINFDDIKPNFFKVLSQMAPFGPMNMSPVFVSSNLSAHNINIVKEKHLKFTVNQEGNSAKFDAIGFNMNEYQKIIQNGTAFDMAYSIEINNHKGLRTLQLVVKDIKKSHNEA